MAGLNSREGRGLHNPPTLEFVMLLETPNQRLPIRYATTVLTPEDLAQVVINDKKNSAGEPLQLEDVEFTLNSPYLILAFLGVLPTIFAWSYTKETRWWHYYLIFLTVLLVLGFLMNRKKIVNSISSSVSVLPK